MTQNIKIHIEIEIMVVELINMILVINLFLLDIMEKGKKHLIIVINLKMMLFIKICLLKMEI